MWRCDDGPGDGSSAAAPGQPPPARDVRHIEFAHRLIDRAGIDVEHGHSCHHILVIEAYRDRPIFYGCGDFLGDYEGIRGYEEFRSGLGLMYFASLDPASGKLARLHMTPTRVREMKVKRAARPDAVWLQSVLNREGQRFGTRVELEEDQTLTLRSPAV